MTIQNQTTDDETRDAKPTQVYDRGVLRHIDGAPVVLNIGCGTDDEGVGIDKHYEPDIRHDLDAGIPVTDSAVDRIKAEHILEHVRRPLDLIDEMYRVLDADGVAEIEVPNAGWWPVRLWLSQDIQGFWSHKDPDREGHWLARRLGNTAPERTRHNTLWTRRLLVEHLERAGFAVETESSHLSRNIRITARKQPGDTTTLHALEREARTDLASGDYWAQTRARILSDWVAESDPDSVLDLGCGSGYLTARIADQLDGATVRGIDRDEESIAVATDRVTAATFEVGDLFEVDASNVDVVLLADVIEHFEAPEQALAAARDCLAPDGEILVSVPAHPSLFGPHDEANGHHERYHRDRLAAVGSDAGLRLTRSRHTNVIPLVPYWIYQRVLERRVPNTARGGHGRVLDTLKQAAIELETRAPAPVGITLLGRFERR
jgi:2-polyprenyl-3-methyl-5-hydroxy-6-metoxy-1,4-benzoquinol methylase